MLKLLRISIRKSLRISLIISNIMKIISAQIIQRVPPPPPPPQPLPPPPTLPRPAYRPLPTLPQPPRRQVFEPQVYEPQSQQTYEPLQQSFEAPQQALEDRVRPQKCDCNQPNPEQTQVSYGIKGAQSVIAPVKGRLSPSRNLNSFLPKAFRMRRDSTSAESDSAEPSGVGSAQISFSVIDPNENQSELN